MTDQDEQQRQADMLTTARELGLIDLDLLALTRKSVPATVAVKELQLRYPAAFRPPFNARAATKAEADAAWRELMAKPERDRQQAFIDMMNGMGDARKMTREEWREAQRKVERFR